MSDVSAISTELDKMDYLNLLVSQLENQNPMDPVDDSAFIAQLAQFSALEAATKTADAVSELTEQDAKTYAVGLLGKQVSGTTSSDASFSGTVTAVDISSSTPKVYVNGRAYTLSEITKVG